jgi:hypothetical protein
MKKNMDPSGRSFLRSEAGGILDLSCRIHVVVDVDVGRSIEK